jgi:hypothetical protein
VIHNPEFSIMRQYSPLAAPGKTAMWLCAASLAVAFTATAAGAQPVTFEGSSFVNKGLVGVARVPSNAVDQLGDTLGGFGSGMALLPGTWRKKSDGSFVGSLVMVPDRGWNTQGTVDYQGRLQRFDVRLQPFTGTSTTDQNQLSMTYKKSIRFHEKKMKPTTGSDPTAVRAAAGGFPALPVGTGGRISVDNETVIYPGNGTMWVSDEYGPYVYHYTVGGNLIGVIRPPEAFIPKRLSGGVPVDDFSANSPPAGVVYNPPKGNPVSGRQNNQGFEGMAISPDHKKLFVLLQSATIQDLNATSAATIRTSRRNTRLLAYDITQSTPALVGEYVVQLPQYVDTVSGETRTAAQSEMLALNDHQFLVIARDSGAGFALAADTSLYRSVDLIDIADPVHPATNIAGTAYDSPSTPVAPHGVLDSSITPVAYQKFVDIDDNAQLNRFGLHNGAPNDSNDLYEKWESMAVAPAFDKQNPNDYFLFIGSDNDFITKDGHMVGQPYSDIANVDTLVLVYRVTLPTYVAPKK